MKAEPLSLMIALSALLGAPAAAQTVSMETRLFVETYEPGKDGTMQAVLKPAALVTPGDRLVYVISYRNGGRQPVSDFIITNPIAAGIEFSGGESSGAEMSVDDGRSWGPLVRLTVRKADGASRPAQRADVTHLRWRFDQPLAPGAAGQVRFKARLK